MKKLLLSLLVVMMVSTTVVGCGTSDKAGSSKTQASEGGSTDTGNSAVESETSEGDLAAQVIAERKASGKYPTVVFTYMNYVGAPSGVNRIQEALSEYTREQLGVNVELELIDSGSFVQQMNLKLSSGEKMDLFVGYSLGYSNCVNRGYVLDLEENNLIQTYGQGILETMSPGLVEACRFNGKLYCLPQQRDYGQGKFAICIGKEYLDAIGYDYGSLYENAGDDTIYSDVNTINDIFAQLHEAFPEKYVYAPRSANRQHGFPFDTTGGDLYGGLLDPEGTELVNMWATEEFKEFCGIFYNWNQLGYISADAVTDSTEASAQIKAGSAMAYMMAGKPGLKQQVSNTCGRDMIVIQIGDNIIQSSTPYGIPMMINAGTEDPVAAMQVYNLLYTDPYASNLLCWGQEGVDYKLMDDGHITFMDGVTSETTEWNNNVNWEMPNQYIAHVWEGNDLDIWEKTEAFNNSSIRFVNAEGFIFDNAEVAAESTAIANVVSEYEKRLYYGFLEPEAGLAEMNEKLEAAGLGTYIAAKQAAFDRWLAEKGN